MIGSPTSLALSLLIGTGGLVGTGALATALGWVAQILISVS